MVGLVFRAKSRVDTREERESRDRREDGCHPTLPAGSCRDTGGRTPGSRSGDTWMSLCNGLQDPLGGKMADKQSLRKATHSHLQVRRHRLSVRDTERQKIPISDHL